MGLLRLTLVTCILLISGPAFAQSWIEYTSRQDLFSINFPGEPTVEDTTYTSQYEAEYPARVYTRHNGESRYSITVVDHTDAERIFKERGPLGAHSECRNRCWIVDHHGTLGGFVRRGYARWRLRFPALPGRSCARSRCCD